MRKSRIALFLICFSLIALLPVWAQPSQESPGSDGENTTLKVYCYDSFASEWGPGPALAALTKSSKFSGFSKWGKQPSTGT